MLPEEQKTLPQRDGNRGVGDHPLFSLLDSFKRTRSRPRKIFVISIILQEQLNFILQSRFGDLVEVVGGGAEGAAEPLELQWKWEPFRIFLCSANSRQTY